MLLIHERTQRYLVRAGFVALCLCPTFAVLAWGAWESRPRQAVEAQQELSARFQLDVMLGGISHPAPGTTEYRKLVLHDPETERRLAACDRLRIIHDAGRISIEAEQLTLVPQAAPLLESWLAQRLRMTDGETVQVQFDRVVFVESAATSGVDPTAAEATPDDGPIASEKTLATYCSVTGKLTHSPERSQARVEFDESEFPDSPRPRLRVVRDRSDAAPFTAVVLDTQGAELPCRLAAEVAPAAAALGAQSSFAGTVTFWPSPAGMDVKLGGVLKRVDLHRLIGDPLGEVFQGTGTLALDQLLILRGRLERVSGELQAQGGAIDASLVNRAAAQLQMGVSTQRSVPPPAGPMPYDQLGVRFQLSATGLSLEGACEGREAAAVMTGPYATLTLLDPHLPRQVAKLASVVAPAGLPPERWAAAVRIASLLPLATLQPNAN